MRIPRRPIPIQPLTHLWERHKEIARLQVSGLKPIEIAQRLSMTPCRVSIIMNSPVYVKYLGTLSTRRDESALDMQAILLQGAEAGVKHLRTFMDDNDTTKCLRTKIATEFLDRSGFGKITTQRNENISVILTGENVRRIKEERAQLLRKMTSIPQHLIDITPSGDRQVA